jgi:TRAP-type mannitol/chloroaromatic compound transport system permease large subunit
VPFILVQLLTLALVAGFPSLATWLPQRVVGY